MKTSEAKQMICPYLTKECICEKCMMWVTTVDGKKEIDRIIEPYDMTPSAIADWKINRINEGYVNIGNEYGFRDEFVKYEKSFEGYCKIRGENK